MLNSNSLALIHSSRNLSVHTDRWEDGLARSTRLVILIKNIFIYSTFYSLSDESILRVTGIVINGEIKSESLPSCLARTLFVVKLDKIVKRLNEMILVIKNQ